MAGSRHHSRSGARLRRRQAKLEQPRPTGRIAPDELVLDRVHQGRGELGSIAIAGHRVIASGTVTVGSTNGRAFYPRTHPGAALSVYADAGTFYLCCLPDRIVRSTDFGETWKPIELPASVRDPSIVYRDAQDVWWLSSRYGPMLTANKPTAGWRASVLTEDPIHAFAELGTRLFYVGDRSGVWNGAVARPLDVPPVRRLAVFRDGSMLALGPTGAYRSGDRGRTFVQLPLDPVRGFADFAWVAGALIAISDTAIVRWTGRDFVRVATPHRVRLHAIASWGDGALICGDDGTILRLASPDDPYWSTTTDELAPTRLGIASDKPKPLARELREQARMQLTRDAIALHDELAAPLIAARPVEQNARLAQLVEEAPDDDRTALQVYADWLHVEGDRRAELAAIQLQLEQEPDVELAAVATALLGEHASELLGPIAPVADQLRLAWCGGFVRRARLAAGDDYPLVPTLAALLDHPSGRFLRALQLEVEVPNDADRALDVLAARYLPALRSLVVGRFEERALAGTCLDLETLYPGLPQLRSLVVRARSLRLGTIVLPRLEQMSICGDGLVERAARAVATAQWPNLTTLSIEVGGRRTGGTAKPNDFRALFDAAGVPCLVDLAFKYVEFSDELLDRLAGSPLLAQLEVLDLAHGTLSIAGARTLYTRQRAFAHLRRITLDDNMLDADALAMLATTALAIRRGVQRRGPELPPV
ncbi:MAG: hypothetical protein ABI867_37195 [Kofleriaceae bacterium]